MHRWHIILAIFQMFQDWNDLSEHIIKLSSSSSKIFITNKDRKCLCCLRWQNFWEATISCGHLRFLFTRTVDNPFSLCLFCFPHFPFLPKHIWLPKGSLWIKTCNLSCLFFPITLKISCLSPFLNPVRLCSRWVCNLDISALGAGGNLFKRVQLIPLITNSGSRNFQI